MKGAHNHPCTRDFMIVDSSRRSLTEDEKTQVNSMIKYMVSTSELRDAVFLKFGKFLSRKDVVKLREVFGGVKSMAEVLQLLSSSGEVRTKSSNGQIDVICFSLQQQIKFFQSFPEVICIDSTYKTNKVGFSLFQLVATDGCGNGACVMFAFCQRENVVDITFVLEMFKAIMGCTNATRTFVMDNCQAEISVQQVFPHCRIVLCSFHVLRAFGRKFRNSDARFALRRMLSTRFRERFNYYYRYIRHEFPQAYQYLNGHWMNNRRMWARCFRRKYMTLGNGTNNRVESAHKHLKLHLRRNDPLVLTLRKVYNKAKNYWRLRQYDTLLTLQRFRQYDAPQLIHVHLDKLTPYAAKLVFKDYQRVGRIHHSVISSDLIDCYDGVAFNLVDISNGVCGCHHFHDLRIVHVGMQLAF
nr:unnamed protein product [Trichobilharzia regenti]